MSKSKVRFQYAQGDITDANYLYHTLVGEAGVAPSLPRQQNGSYLLSELEDGRSIVLSCPSFPKLVTSHGYAKEFDGSDVLTVMEEMYVNGMGTKMDFAENAYIRILTPGGKAEPLVFRDLKDALAYVGV